jgi:hypothetical protein
VSSRFDDDDDDRGESVPPPLPPTPPRGVFMFDNDSVIIASTTSGSSSSNAACMSRRFISRICRTCSYDTTGNDKNAGCARAKNNEGKRGEIQNAFSTQRSKRPTHTPT